MNKSLVVVSVVGGCAAVGVVVSKVSWRVSPVQASTVTVGAPPASAREEGATEGDASARSPEEGVVAASASGARAPDFLTAVCAGAPARGKDGAWSCEVADACEGIASTQATVAGAYAGHFSASDKEELLLDLQLECASHAESWGGFAFLRREAGVWTKVALAAGDRPGTCTSWTPSDAERTTLVCETGHTNFGHTYTFLHHVVVDATGAASRELIVDALDDAGASDCHARADTLAWRLDAGVLHVDYRASAAEAELPDPPECATPLPRVDKAHAFAFVREGTALRVTTEGRDAYAAWKAVQSQE